MLCFFRGTKRNKTGKLPPACLQLVRTLSRDLSWYCDANVKMSFLFCQIILPSFPSAPAAQFTFFANIFFFFYCACFSLVTALCFFTALPPSAFSPPPLLLLLLLLLLPPPLLLQLLLCFSSISSAPVAPPRLRLCMLFLPFCPLYLCSALTPPLLLLLLLFSYLL